MTVAMQHIDRGVLERLARKVGVEQGAVMEVVDDTLTRMREAWMSLEDELPLDAQFRAKLQDHQRSVPLVSSLAS